MKRFLFNFFAAASLVTAAFIAALGVRSYWVAGSMGMNWWRWNSQSWNVLVFEISHGGVRACYVHQHFKEDRGKFVGMMFPEWGYINNLSNRPNSSDNRPFASWKTAAAQKYPASPNLNPVAGFGFFHEFVGDPLRPVEQSRYECLFPLWALAAFFALLPAAWGVTIWRTRSQGRLQYGHCSRCGYDLRASKTICPECGSPANQTRVGTANLANLARLHHRHWLAAAGGVTTVVLLCCLVCFGATHFWKAECNAYFRQREILKLDDALLDAANINDTSAIRRLLDQGADVQICFWHGQETTPLSRVAQTCHLESAELLLARGANINAHPSGAMTALYEAVRWRELDMTRFLLDHGAEPNITGSNGISPLLCAVTNEIHGSFDADPIGNQIAVLLIDHGADMNVRDPDGATPLLHSIKEMRWQVTRKLIERGSDVNAADHNGQTALICLPIAPRPRFALTGNDNLARLITAALLIDHGANINARDSAGDSALMKATMENNVEIARWLIEHGADVNAANKQGQTPLSYAASDAKYAAMEKLLRESGAKPYRVTRSASGAAKCGN
jgi:ankyrin repeat protein